jgi:nitric oxide reductase subunit C
VFVTAPTRKRLMIGLVLIFFLQTWFVYTDPAGRRTPPLSREAARGRGIWHDRNCQSCHQLYGFGGFLGPDLTNAHERLSKARLDSVLTDGAGQMPAFHLDERARSDVAAFLAEIHETGRGQLKPQKSFDAAAVLSAVFESATDLSPALARGRLVMAEQKCIGCHLPNPRSEKNGTDLTTVIKKLGPRGVQGMLEAGIPAKGMPKFTLASDDMSALIVCLEWLGANQATVHGAFANAAPAELESTGLPWFEYE